MRSILPAGATWTEVNKKGGGGESIRPKLWRHVSMKNKSANTSIDRAEDAFSLAVLL